MGKVENSCRFALTEQLLRDEDRPVQNLARWQMVGVRFHLRLRTRGLLRVYHWLGGDYESFQSVIVTPSMCCNDLVQMAVGRYPGERLESFELVERTASGEGEAADRSISACSELQDSPQVPPLFFLGQEPGWKAGNKGDVQK